MLFVVVVCASPQRAQAGCGDYVTILSATAVAKTHAMPPVQVADGVPAPARMPCHGPNCSGAPTRDFPASPASPVSQPVKEQAQGLAHAIEADPFRGSLDLDFTSLRPVRRATSIFHPPRIG